MINLALLLLIGYFLGSISPAYILGRILRGIDLRTVGEKNAGTTNVYHILGLFPAIITGLFDFSKGLIAMYIAYKLGAPLLAIYLTGMAAVIGHIFPFYLNFRGGQGVATCVGILFYLMFTLLKSQFLPWESIVILAITVLAILIITKQKYFLALIVMPALAYIIFKNYHFNLTTFFAGLILVYIFGLNIYLSYKRHLFDLKEKTLDKIRPWRTVMRPLAIVFPMAYFYVDKSILLWIIGVIGLIFVIMDLARLGSKNINLFFQNKATKVYKKGEEKRFSSISLFFISSFLVILIFPKMIAILALSFLIFGDVFAKFFGLEYGRMKLFGEKTLEGSLAHFTICLLVGYILWPYVGLSPVVILAGVFSATISEALPLGVNDNLSVSLISGAIMYIVQMFI